MTVEAEKSVVIHRHKNRKYYDTFHNTPVNLTEIFTMYRQGDLTVTTKSFADEARKKDVNITEDTVLQAIFKVCLNGRFENKKAQKTSKRVLSEAQLAKLRRNIMECVRNL